MNEWLRELLLLPRQGSTIAEDIDRLHYFVIGVTMLGSFAVAAVAGYFVIRYRKGRRPGPPIDPIKRFKMPLKLEIGLVATLVLLFFGWWLIGLRQYMRIRVPPENAAEVYVTAKQWMFKFSYPEGNSSVDTLYVPAGKPIKLVMTSRDVIHGFYVPDFRVKQDLVPGRYTSLWFEAPEPGVYELLCAEFCGTGHSQMRGQVVVMTPQDYEVWLEGTTDPSVATLPRDQAPQTRLRRQGLEMVDMGHTVAARNGCLRCHSTDGSPHIGPSFAGLYGATIPLTDGEEVVADEAYLTESMMDPMKRLHAGFQPVMPSYKGRLQPAEVASLVELIKALRQSQRWMDPGAEPGRYPRPQAEGLPRYLVPDPKPRQEDAHE